MVGGDLSHALAPKTNVGTGLTVLLQHRHSRRALTYLGTTACLPYEDLDLAYLASGRHFHLSSFFSRALAWRGAKLLAAMRAVGLTTSLDTNDDPEDLWEGPITETLKHLDILMSSEREACKLANESSFEDAVVKLAEMVPLLVVKRGARGALAVRKGMRYEAPGYITKVVDVIGAGDSYNAGVLHAFVHGAALNDCLALGNACLDSSTTASEGVKAFSDSQGLQRFLESRGVAENIVF